MKLEFNFSSNLKIANSFQGARFEKLKRTLFTILLRQKDLLFRDGKSPDDTAWAQLSNKQIDQRNKKIKNPKKKGNIKILVDTGALRNSLTNPSAPYQVVSTSGNEVALGTNIPYAAIQNFGGSVNIPLIKNGFGLGIEIPAHTVIIPARPFIGFGQRDDDQVKEAIEAHLKKGKAE